MFIACIENEENIHFFGSGVTPQSALRDFLGGGAFNDHCSSYEVHDGECLEIGIYKKIENGSQDWSEEFDPDWAWALGDQVETHNVVYNQ
tara:strand:+ start:1337 stop:1606 length:270 start_codon:yes stop_codon:yes gene_type:complete